MLDQLGLSGGEEAVDAVEAEGQGDLRALHFGQHPVPVLTPIGEAGKVPPNGRRAGVKDVGAIVVDHDTVLVGPVKGVPGNVVAPVHDMDRVVEAAGDPLRQRRPAKAGADDQPSGPHTALIGGAGRELSDLPPTTRPAEGAHDHGAVLWVRTSLSFP